MDLLTLLAKTPRDVGEGGACRTTYTTGYASPACSQVSRNTERHLRLMEKLLGEQRWKLQALPVRDRWTGHQCVLQGERVHSTRRGHVRPGSPRKSDTG